MLLEKWTPLERAGPAEGVNGAAQEVAGRSHAAADTDGGATRQDHLPLESDFSATDEAVTTSIDVENLPNPIATPLPALARTVGLPAAEGVDSAAQEVAGRADAEEDTDAVATDRVVATPQVHLWSDSDFPTTNVAVSRSIGVEDPRVGAEQEGASRDEASSAGERIIPVARGENGSIGLGIKETKFVRPASGGDELAEAGGEHLPDMADRNSGRRILIEMILPGSTSESSGGQISSVCVQSPPASTPAVAARSPAKSVGLTSLKGRSARDVASCISFRCISPISSPPSPSPSPRI